MADSAWSCTCTQCRRKALYQAAKVQVFAHYGTACACCGSTQDLTVDHINGGGTTHLRVMFGVANASYQFYRWLVRSGFPPGFQTLCRPCNSSKKDGPACRLDHQSPPGTKRCAQCGKIKSADDYYTGSRRCKPCFRGRDRSAEQRRRPRPGAFS